MSKENSRDKYERKAIRIELAEIGIDLKIVRLLEHSIELNEATVGLLGETVTLLKRIDRILTPRQVTKSVAAIFTQPLPQVEGAPSPMPVSPNVLELNVGQTSTLTPTGFLDTGFATLSGATPSGVTYTFSDPSATVVPNPDGITALVTGVAASTAGAVTGSFTCTMTDTDGVASSWTVSFTVLVDGVTPPPPAQLTQAVAAVFSTPQ